MQMRGPYHTIIALYCTGITQPHSGSSSRVGFGLSVGAFVGVFTFTASADEVINHCGCASAFNVRCRITWHETEDTVCYPSFIYHHCYLQFTEPDEGYWLCDGQISKAGVSIGDKTPNYQYRAI